MSSLAGHRAVLSAHLPTEIIDQILSDIIYDRGRSQGMTPFFEMPLMDRTHKPLIVLPELIRFDIIRFSVHRIFAVAVMLEVLVAEEEEKEIDFWLLYGQGVWAPLARGKKWSGVERETFWFWRGDVGAEWMERVDADCYNPIAVVAGGQVGSYRVWRAEVGVYS